MGQEDSFSISAIQTKNKELILGKRIGIVFTEWNNAVTSKLKDGAIKYLKEFGFSDDSIICKIVPGSFELIFGAKVLREKFGCNGILCVGTIIRGETSHYDVLCDAVSHGVTELNLHYDSPFIFCVLTTDNLLQAEERAGGKHGNKGIEAAYSLLKMMDLSYK